MQIGHPCSKALVRCVLSCPGSTRGCMPTRMPAQNWYMLKDHIYVLIVAYWSSPKTHKLTSLSAHNQVIEEPYKQTRGIQWPTVQSRSIWDKVS